MGQGYRYRFPGRDPGPVVASKGHGKRGGARIFYFWFVTPGKLLMLFAFPKNAQADLNHSQLKILKQIVQEEYT